MSLGGKKMSVTIKESTELVLVDGQLEERQTVIVEVKK